MSGRATGERGPAAPADLAAQVRDLARPAVDGAGLELVDVDVRGQRGSRVVRIVVDADEGVDIDRCAALSRTLSAALDEDDFIPGRYTLEVTSPGADRPLRSARDFRRNLGREVRLVRTRQAIDAGHKGELQGELTAVDAEGVTVDVQGGAEHVPFADIDHGKVVLPW